MNNKGFSMIELHGVIVIIGILAGLAIPAVTKYIGKTRDRAYDNLYESAYAAAQEKYMHDLEDTNKSYSLRDLYDQGYLDEPIDPANKNFCEGDVSITELDNDAASDLEVSEYKIQVHLECTNECREYYSGKDQDKNGQTCT